MTATLNSASKDPVNSLPKLLSVAALIDPSGKTRTYDGHDLVSALTAELTAVVSMPGFGTFGRRELEQQAGGPISSNGGVDYASRVNSVERAQIEHLTPGKLAGWLRQLATAPRVSADQAARAKVDSFGDPTGQLGVPTVTMHTAYDDVVPVQEEGREGGDGASPLEPGGTAGCCPCRHEGVAARRRLRRPVEPLLKGLLYGAPT